MSDQFWTNVEKYANTSWWFGAPAMLLGLAALLLVLVAALRLGERTPLTLGLTTVALAVAVALLLPGVLLTLNREAALGLAGRDGATMPSATFPAVAQTMNQVVQMGYLGGAMLLVGALGTTGAFGGRRANPCPQCGRERHPGWKNICPECRLMEPGVAESPLMRLGDLSASGVDVTQFGAPAQTALLDSTTSDVAWVEVTEAISGAGERFAVGARLAIGRDPSQCQLVLDDEAVSSRHAYIERDRATYVLYDAGSRNGTFVNDEQIAHHTLRDGDMLRIGRAALRFTMSDTFDSAPTMLLDIRTHVARITVLDGAQDGEEYALNKLDIRIGRGRQNDVILDAPTVSRYHASIQYDGADFHLVDAGTPNGTWLDETRVIGNLPLRDGQIIRLGNQRLRFQAEDGHDA